MAVSRRIHGRSLLIMLYLTKHDPALLRRRLVGGPMAEEKPQQKNNHGFCFDRFRWTSSGVRAKHRFGWSSAPLAVVILGDVLVVIGFIAPADTDPPARHHSRQRHERGQCEPQRA
jgi:hypothetical protein